MKIEKSRFIVVQRRAVGGLVACVGVLMGALPCWALTNNLTTALTVTSGVETGFDTGATIGLSILVFLVALGFVLKGIRVGKKA